MNNLKELIAQAGFKSQKEFARSMGICPESICGWKKKPEKCPRVYFKYLDLKIETIALREALKTFKQYCNQ